MTNVPWKALFSTLTSLAGLGFAALLAVEGHITPAVAIAGPILGAGAGYAAGRNTS